MTDPAQKVAQATHRLRSRPHVIFGDADSRRVWIDEAT